MGGMGVFPGEVPGGSMENTGGAGGTGCRYLRKKRVRKPGSWREAVQLGRELGWLSGGEHAFRDGVVGHGPPPLAEGSQGVPVYDADCALVHVALGSLPEFQGVLPGRPGADHGHGDDESGGDIRGYGDDELVELDNPGTGFPGARGEYPAQNLPGEVERHCQVCGRPYVHGGNLPGRASARLRSI